MRVFGIAELWGKAYNPAVTAAKNRRTSWQTS